MTKPTHTPLVTIQTLIDAWLMKKGLAEGMNHVQRETLESFGDFVRREEAAHAQDVLKSKSAATPQLTVEPAAPGQWYVTRGRHSSEPPIALFYDHQEAQRYASTAPAQSCGDAEQADGAVTVDIFDWLETEVTAISCRYHGDPCYDHDAYWMRDRVVKLIGKARNVFAVRAKDSK